MEPKLKSAWLIGEITPNLPRGELPTFGDVLRAYFFNNSVLRMTTSSSRLKVARELITIWKDSNTNCIEEKDVIKRMKAAIELYESYKKSRYRRSNTQLSNEAKLEILLNYPFDIAPAVNYHHNKHLKSEQKPKLLILKQKTEKKNEGIEWNVNSDDEMDVDKNIDSNFEDNDTDFETTLTSYQKSKFSNINEAQPDSAIVKKIMNSADVFSTLDRTDISSGKFTRICASILRAIGIDLNECVFSLSTVERRRIVHRDAITTIIKDDFLSDIKSGLVVHWDGKRLKDTTNADKNYRNKKVERVAVVVCGLDTQKIITIAKTENGTGLVVSDVVYNHMEDWNLSKNIFAMCTDTTSANTGETNGAIVLFEKNMKRNLLYFACRHHVYELVIGGVFELLFGESTGPSKSLFENFKRDWWMVNQKKFKPLKKSLFKNNYIRTLRDEAISYVENILLMKDQKFILRGDYKEMLQLCLLVLGKNVPHHTFNVPKNCSNARWMEIVIYTFKMFLFRDQVNLSPDELRDLENFCLFASLIYTKAWIKCCVPSNAPYNDLELLKEMRQYEKVNEDISERALAKFREHLWYIGSELVVLALFSDKVEDEVKRRMFANMRAMDNRQWATRNRRLKLKDPDDFEEIFEKELDDLVDSSSMTVLLSFKVNIGFMFEKDVNEWSNLESYNTAKKIVDSFKVVNDVAERTLKLMTDVNGSLTNNEDEKQRAIQVIEDNRKRVPTTQKYVLSTYKRL